MEPGSVGHLIICLLLWLIICGIRSIYRSIKAGISSFFSKG